MRTASRRPPGPPDSFQEFQASSLFCPRCRVAQPVREHLLLVLPDGELREYKCTVCGASLGSRRTSGGSSLVLG